MYKPIKYLKGVSNFEMSDDALFLRNKTTLKETPIDKASGRASLIMDDGTEKSFGLKTLYWKSWGSPLEIAGLPVEVRGLKAKKSKKEPKAKKVKKLSLKAKKDELISSFALKQLQAGMEKRLKTSGSTRGLMIDDGKTTSCRILVHNTEKNLVLVHVESQAYTKDGYWFMNPESGKSVAFVNEVHKPSYGDSSIQWPTAV